MMSSAVSQYRRRLKTENPDKYAEYLNDQKARAKRRREELKKELQKRKPSATALAHKEKEKLQARERQRKYMEKKRASRDKEDGHNGSQKLTVKITGQRTRLSGEKQRQYWRSAKQKERLNMSRQKKVAIKEKDRLRKRKQRESSKGVRQFAKETKVQENRKSPFSSKKTEWNITSTIRSKLPQTPTKFARVIQNLIQHSSLRKRRAFEELNVKLAVKHKQRSGLRKSLFTSRSQKSALKIAAKKLLKTASIRSVARQTGLSRKTVRMVKTGLKRKKSSLRTDHVALVRKFFCREDVSRIIPQRRYAMKCGPGYLLQISLKAAYSQFLGENPGIKMSFSKFASLRPRNVRLLKNTHREFCLCVYCVNIRYKLLVLSRLCVDKAKKVTKENDLLNVLLCPKSDGARFHDPECIEGRCQKCSDLETTLREYFDSLRPVAKITWNRWTKVEENGKKRRVLETKTGKGEDLLDELVQDVMRPCTDTTFIQHVFNANWQYMQYNNLKSSLPENCVMLVMDFAKNRTISYQDEIKSAYFGARQVTIHPVVVHFNKNGQIVRDCLIFISDDIQHDYHAVQTFKSIADVHIKEVLGRDPIVTFIFSDGCSCQYKSRGPFADLSLMAQKTNRNFFGSEHGKCESDGETGVLNRALDRAILSRSAVMNNGKDIFKYCVENLSLEESLTKRHFCYVASEDINRNRPFTDVKTLPQTRKIHQIMNIPGHPYTIKTRNLSCFCGVCLSDGGSVCINKEYVHSFKAKILKRAPAAVVVEDLTNTTSEPGMIDAAIEALVEDTCVQSETDCSCETGGENSKHGIIDAAIEALVEDTCMQSEIDCLCETREQNRMLKPSAFVQLFCMTEHNRIFHYVAQVTNVPDEDGQPFKTKKSIWAWGESREDFVIDRHQIERVLSEPEIIPTRTGAIYFHFPDLD